MKHISTREKLLQPFIKVTIKVIFMIDNKLSTIFNDIDRFCLRYLIKFIHESIYLYIYIYIY